MWHDTGSVAVCVPRLGGRRRKFTHHLPCSWRSLPRISVLPKDHSEIGKQISVTYTPGTFKLLLHAVSLQSCLLCCLLKDEDSVSFCPPSSPEPSLLIFKVLLSVLSPTDYMNSQNLPCPVYKTKCYWNLSSPCGFPVPGVRICFYPSQCPWHPSIPWIIQFSFQTYLCPSHPL